MILLFIGIRNNRKQKLLIKYGVTVNAKVIDNYEDNVNSSRLYYPIVEFEDTHNNKQKMKLSIGTSVYRKIGSHIKIVYDPNNPESEVFEFTNSISLPNLIFIIVGVVFVTIGVIGMILKLLWNSVVS